METNIVYFDETGDDGSTTASSDTFILTALYMNSNSWQSNFNKLKNMRKDLKERFGLHISQEIHTKFLLSDKDPYREYKWSVDQKQEILKTITLAIADMELSVINTVIDKTRFIDKNYPVLENALKYTIQRVENDSAGKWNYIIITDEGRIGAMRKTARAIRAYNPIQSKYSFEFNNQPINNLLEDILEKESHESYFIQMCDFISYFVHLYYKTQIKKLPLPNRVGKTVDNAFVKRVMITLEKSNVLNLNASKNEFGLVVYPK